MVAIWGFIGPEGAGKTTAMTWFMEYHMALGGTCRSFPGYELYSPHGALVQDIDIKELIRMSGELKNVVVGIDEIQQFNDSSRHMTTINQLTGYVGMQRRKLSLGIFYTLQNWMWLYDRMRWLTHLLTVCSDLHFSPWGKENHIRQGEYMSIITYDCKGFLTGQPWSPLTSMVLRPRELWPYYRSYNVIDIFEGQERIQIKKRLTVYDLNKAEPTFEQIREASEDTPPVGLKAPRMTESEVELYQRLSDQGVPMSDIREIRKMKQGV